VNALDFLNGNLSQIEATAAEIQAGMPKGKRIGRASPAWNRLVALLEKTKSDLDTVWQPSPRRRPRQPLQSNPQASRVSPERSWSPPRFALSGSTRRPLRQPTN
jgi:hypothetical protein